MKYDQGDPAELKQKFWKALAASPYVMLQLEDDPSSAAPMTAQLDEDANHAVWFFTGKDNHFAKLGGACVTFTSKGHDVFARVSGVLFEEHDPARLDKEWNNFVESWFPGGKDDPNLLLMRLELGDAAIWAGDMGVFNTVKMALGLPVRDSVKGGYTETRL